MNREHHAQKWRETCPIIREAKSLIASLEITEVPDDFSPGGYMPQTLAEWRHKCTNYEYVLYQLSDLCLSQSEQKIWCHPDDLEADEECPLKEEVHLMLKEAAEDLYWLWWDTRQEGGKA